MNLHGMPANRYVDSHMNASWDDDVPLNRQSSLGTASRYSGESKNLQNRARVINTPAVAVRLKNVRRKSSHVPLFLFYIIVQNRLGLFAWIRKERKVDVKFHELRIF